MSRRILLIGRSGSGKTSLILRIHEITGSADLPVDLLTDAKMSKQSLSKTVPDLRVANKTQAAVYHPDFIDVPGEYLEVRSLYRALIMLTCEACGIALVQAANDGESLFPTGLARTFDKPVIGIVTKTDAISSDNAEAESILRDAGAKKVFYTSALTNSGIVELTRHLITLRGSKGSNSKTDV